MGREENQQAERDGQPAVASTTTQGERRTWIIIVLVLWASVFWAFACYKLINPQVGGDVGFITLFVGPFAFLIPAGLLSGQDFGSIVRALTGRLPVDAET